MAKILLVDEEKSNHSRAVDLLKKSGTAAVHGSLSNPEFMATLEFHQPDIVLMELPAGDEVPQLTVLEPLHRKMCGVPIVLLTAGTLTPSIIQALENEAPAVVANGSAQGDLPSILENVLKLSRFERRSQRLAGYLCQAESRFCLQNDPLLIRPLVGHLQETAGRMKGMDQAQCIQLGIALHEGLLNAMYHGNLEVSSELRQLSESSFLAEATKRRKTSPYKERCIDVSARVTAAEAAFVIRDEGPGFDLMALPDPTAPDNLVKASGRGILLMRIFVDVMQYNKAGNELTLIKKMRSV